MEERPGWKWNKVGDGGYWSKVTGPSHKHKLEFFCPLCKRPTGTIDDKFLKTVGFCSSCYVLHCESRKTPDIDISKYAKVDLDGVDLSNKEFLSAFKDKS